MHLTGLGIIVWQWKSMRNTPGPQINRSRACSGPRGKNVLPQPRNTTLAHKVFHQDDHQRRRNVSIVKKARSAFLSEQTSCLSPAIRAMVSAFLIGIRHGTY